jgi:SAM-dependent methyltransferase
MEISRHYYLANLSQTVELSYSICETCQFIFQGEYVGDEFLNHYYSKSPMLRRKEPTVFEEDQNRRQAEFLSKHVELEGRRVLEIGAHAGAFLSYLYKKFGCITYFEELSEEARAVLTSQAGLTDFRSLKDGSKIDVVILRHVLEHIFDLDSFLDYISTLLSEDGSLFIEVPDWSCYDAHTDPLIFEHLNQFNTANIVQLLARLGWRLDGLEKSIHLDDPATPNRVQRIIARPSRIPRPGDSAIADVFCAFAQVQYVGWRTAINALLEGEFLGKRIALYPASHLTFEALTGSNLNRASLLGMYDVDEKKQGQKILGLNVYAPNELKNADPDVIFIFTMGYEREIRESFRAMNLRAKVISITELVNNSWNRV